MEEERTMTDRPLGRFCWYELMTTGPDEAPDFYAAVTGWGTIPFDGAGEPYTMWTNGETPIGGIMRLPKEAIDAGAPPHWLPYVSTPDIAATKTKALDLGANVLAEIDIPTVGTVAVMSDPQGAVFAAYEPEGDAPGHDGPGEVGEFSWHELYAEDADAAFAFYRDLFGWKETGTMDMGEQGLYRMFGTDTVTYGGMMKLPEPMPAPQWLLYARVPDIDAAAAAVEEAGGEVWNGPMEIPGGDFVAHCRDPQGTMFALHASAAAD
jgi:predicted enzyme related to lactoylglutathione lyase